MHRLPKIILLIGLLAMPTYANGQVDGERLMRDLFELSSDAFEGREAGSSGGALARDYIREGFMSIGLEPCGESYDQPFSFGSRNGGEIRAANLVAVVPGTENEDVFIVVTAHYDHVGRRNGVVYNGADDNASGTAALLAVGAHFLKTRPRHSIVIAALDAEEKGLQGARAFLADPCVDREAIWMNVNLDMISRSEKGELYATGTYQHPELRPILSNVDAVAGVTLRFGHDEPGTGRDNWTNASDHGPFHASGIPFIYFGVEDHEDYHRPSDDAEKIDKGFYVSVVGFIIDAISELDAHLDEIHSVNEE